MTRDAVTALTDLDEELGTLAEVPEEWIKLFTDKGAGDQSTISLIKKGVRSTRELGTLVKTGNDPLVAGYFLKKSSGEPVGIISYTGEGGKPWRFYTPSGDAVTRTVVNYRRVPSWRAPTRSYTDSTGKVVSYKDRFARERKEMKHRDVSLNDIAGLIDFAGGVDLYAINKDVARAAKHSARLVAQAPASDLDTIRKGVEQKFLASKTSGPRAALKARIAAIGDEIKKKLDDTALMADQGSRFGDVGIDSSKIRELNTLLYDLQRLSELTKSSAGENSGLYRRGNPYWRNGGKVEKNWNFQSLSDKLDTIQARLAKLSSEGKYGESANRLVKSALSRSLGNG